MVEPMPKYRLLSALWSASVLIGGACFFALWIWLHPARPHIHPRAFKRIHNGMHRAEIQEILGGPPGDYRKGPKYLSPFSLKNIRLLDDDSPVEEFEEFWWGDAFVVKIIFDT